MSRQRKTRRHCSVSQGNKSERKYFSSTGWSKSALGLLLLEGNLLLCFCVLKPAPGLIIAALIWTALKNCWWFNVNRLNNTNKVLGKWLQHKKFHLHCPRKSSATTEQFSSALHFLQEVVLGFLSIFWLLAFPIWELVAPCHHFKDGIPVTNNLWALPAAHWCL